MDHRSLVLPGDSHDALRRNEARFRSMVSAFTDFVFVCSADGRLLTDMPTWREVTGQTEEQLLGWGWLDGVHEDDRRHAAEVWRTAVETEDLYVVEYRITGPGGTTHLDVRGAPVRDEHGTVVEWVGSCTDVTVQRRLARDLEDERETLRRVVEQTRTAVVLLRGPELVFTHFNEAYLDMVPEGRARIGLPMAEALPETAHLVPSFHRVLAGETLEWRELPIAFEGPRSYDGFRYYHVSYSPVTFADDLRGVLGVGVEVTDEVRRRSDLERRLEEERRLGADLQQALLPESLPSLDGLDLAVRYAPASDRVGVGGDWFDVLELSPERVVLVIGDVAGTGLDAATAMAQLRAAVRAHALEGHPPAAVLDRASQYCARLDVAPMATGAVVALDPRTGALEWATAGHPPPLLALGDGDAHLLRCDAQPPLGLAREPYRGHAAVLPDDAALVLYTDGLVERRGVPVDSSIEELRLVTRGEWTTAATLRDAISDAMPHAGEDDIALLVCRRPSGRWTHRRFEADPAQVMTMRNLAAGAAADAGLDRDGVERVRLVTSEAATNAVVHARRHEPGPIDLTLAVHGGELVVLVTDHGAGVTPRPDSPGAGVGVEIMRALADRVEWSRPGTGGTTVTMGFRLPG